MFMPPGQNWPFPYNHSTNHAMDVDSPNSCNSSDGEWVGHARYRLLQDIHRENKTCNDPVGHTAAAECNNDASYIATIKLIEDDIARPHRENAKQYKAKVSSLEAKLSSLQAEHDAQLSKMRLDFNQNQLTVLVANPTQILATLVEAFRIHDQASVAQTTVATVMMITQLFPNPAALETLLRLPNLSIGIIFRYHFPVQEMGFSVLEHSRFHTGFDQSLVTINWDDAEGLGHISALVDKCISTNTSPTPTVFTEGTQTGIQSIPSSHANLESLVGGAITEGNISALHCLRFALVIAQMLEQTRDIDPRVNPFYRSKKDILSKVREANPEWARSSKFLDSRTYRLKEAPREWKNSIQLPAAGAPQDDANRHNYVAWAHYMFIFGDSNALLGIFMSDTGYIDLESVRASCILYDLTPIRSAKDRLAFDAFRLAFIRVVSKPGFFEYLVRRYNLTISNVMKTYSNEYVARILADSGLKEDTVNSMLRFAWQFAIDMQQLSSNPES
ncbi:hypothetical protein L218DRAFT_952021, partial [Marasmius fiardii PR-910]